MILTRVKSATSEFIKVLRYGKSDIQTSDPVLPHGIDSKPVKNDLALFEKTNSSSQSVILGYIKLFEQTKEGETRIYATDSDGNDVFDIYLKNDGTCEIGGDSDFMVRFNELKSGFDQLKNDFNNFINTKYNTHVHTGVTTGPGSSAVTPQLGTPSSASIDAAKINEIKTL